MMPSRQELLPVGGIARGSYQEQYVVESIVGQGGFSAVYLVRELNGKKQLYALKEVINPDSYDRSNLTMEAETLRRLDHPSLPHVYQVFENTRLKRIYLLMDFIEGKNLETLRQEKPDGRLTLDLMFTLMHPIAEAISYLHTQKPPVLHRDIKPSNIIVSESNNAFLVDFGLAKEYSLNATTDIIRHGTPGYAAPEQYSQGTNPRTDIYGLASTIYTLLTGKMPVDALTRAMNQQIHDPLIRADIMYPTIPSSVGKIIERAMSLRSENRFATVEEFWQALMKSYSLVYPISSPNTKYPTDIYDKGDSRLQHIWHTLTIFAQKVYIARHSSFGVPPTALFPESHVAEDSLKDFFISYASYNDIDFLWGEWIKWQLDKAGYSTILPPWGIRLESNIDAEIQKATAKAKRVISVLSPAYLQILRQQQAWINIFKENSTQENPKILPICGQECGQDFRELLESINYVSLANMDEMKSTAILLAVANEESIKLTKPPSFPGKIAVKSLPSNELSTQMNIENSTSSDLLNPLPRVKNEQYRSAQEKSTEEITTNTEFALNSSKDGLEIFFSYSHQDRGMRDELEKYLSNLKRQRSITGWYDGEIDAGDEWAQEIDRHLKQANIILLLISQDFLASNYCYETEMLHALERHNNGEACVIPIILRPAHWEVTPFRKLQVLPKGAKPITTWQNRDEAFLSVTRDIQKVVSKLSKKNYNIHSLNIDI